MDRRSFLTALYVTPVQLVEPPPAQVGGDISRYAAKQADSVHRENRNFATISEFGAAGDGRRDDSPAFQAAVDTLHNSPYGGKLFIPAATYLINTQIMVPKIPGKHLVIVGDG